jgi:hypothetical protein
MKLNKTVKRSILGVATIATVFSALSTYSQHREEAKFRTLTTEINTLQPQAVTTLANMKVEDYAAYNEFLIKNNLELKGPAAPVVAKRREAATFWHAYKTTDGFFPGIAAQKYQNASDVIKSTSNEVSMNFYSK